MDKITEATLTGWGLELGPRTDQALKLANAARRDGLEDAGIVDLLDALTPESGDGA